MSDAISTYLTISKNETAAIDKFAASDPTTEQGVAALTKAAPSIGSPTALLNDQAALAVVLGAFNMTADSSETAVLKALMTQDPTSSTSLAVTSNNADFKAFAEFMQNVSTVNVALGSPGAMTLNTSGSDASTVTVQNTAFSAAVGASATNVGTQWGFVLNDGTANASVASALEAAAGTGTYTINADGSVTGSNGAPKVTAQKDSNGDDVYTLTLAANGSGQPTKQVQIVSVPVTAGASTTSAASQSAALVKAIQAQGFSATLSTSGTLAISGNGIDASTGSGGTSAANAHVSNISFSTKATAPSGTSSNVLALGKGAAGLQAGQVIMDGATVIGTVKSVDENGNVTLTGNAQAAIAVGDTITAAPTLTATDTPALENAARVATAISEYQTNQFENAQDQQNPGMHSALYFTRQIGAVTSIPELMSDPALLSVVTTNLGLQPDQFGALDFTQQEAILTKNVDVSKFQDPTYVKQAAEQYLILNQQNQPAPLPTGLASLFGGGADPSQELFAILGGTTLTSNSTTQSSSNPEAALFV